MPKKDYPMYEAIKQKAKAEGMSEDAAQTKAARITNSKGKPVPPARPKKKSR